MSTLSTVLHLIALTGQTTDQSAPVGGVVLVAGAVFAVVMFIVGAVVAVRAYAFDDEDLGEVDEVEEESDTLTV